MAKIAVFGGSFDPVHNAHEQIARLVLKEINPAKIIFVPAYAPPHKTKQFADICDRIAMLKFVVGKLDKSEISYFEAEQQKVVYSYQTLDYFRSIYPEDEIYMIIGSDSLAELPTWKNIDYLSGRYKFIVAKRPEIEIAPDTEFIDRCVILNTGTESISSSMIRNMIKCGDGRVAGFLDKKVLSYINEYGLYK